MKKRLLLIVSIFLCGFVFAQNRVIEPELEEILNTREIDFVRVNIIFKAKADTKTNTDRDLLVEELKSFSKISQADVMSILRAEEKSNNARKIKSHWLVNAINCELSRNAIYKISSHPDIAVIGHDKEDFLLWDSETHGLRSSEVKEFRAESQSISHINADDVWALGYTGKNVLVALLDTGVNIEHIDLVDNLWDGGEEFPNHGYNTYEDNHNVNDGFGHGTHCAGIICGSGATGTQTGIAPDATIMVVKVMDDGGYGGASGICSGIEFAIEHGADLLNMSLGIPNASASAKEMLRTSCENTLQLGIAATVAAGNEGQLQISFPAPNNVRTPGACPPPWIHPDQEVNVGGRTCCIVVGAVDFNNNSAPFSSRGPVTWQETSYNDYPYNPGIGLIRPDVCAPGVGIISANPFNSNGLTTMDGTSQAAPCTAGVICLMLEKNPQITPEEISRILETTAIKLSDNKNNETGTGLIDALAAIENMDAGNEEEECDAPTSVTASAIDEYSIALSWNAVNSATSYDIYRNGNKIQNTNTTSFNDSDLNPGTEYCYTVKSVCENGESEHSEQACATTNELIAPCDTPTNLEAAVQEDLADFEKLFKVTLTWETVENAEAYYVYLNGNMAEEVTIPSYIYGTDEEETVEFKVMTKCETNESEMSESLTVVIEYQDISEYENKFELYPNPASDYIKISVVSNQQSVIRIYNVLGILINEIEFDSNDIEIDMSGYNTGIYFFDINGEMARIIKN